MRVTPTKPPTPHLLGAPLHCPSRPPPHTHFCVPTCMYVFPSGLGSRTTCRPAWRASSALKGLDGGRTAPTRPKGLAFLAASSYMPYASRGA